MAATKTLLAIVTTVMILGAQPAMTYLVYGDTSSQTLLNVCRNPECGEMVRIFRDKHGDIHPPYGVIECFNIGGTGYKVLLGSQRIQCIIPGEDFKPILNLHDSKTQKEYWNAMANGVEIISMVEIGGVASTEKKVMQESIDAVEDITKQNRKDFKNAIEFLLSNYFSAATLVVTSFIKWMFGFN